MRLDVLYTYNMGNIIITMLCSVYLSFLRENVKDTWYDTWYSYLYNSLSLRTHLVLNDLYIFF